MIGYRFMYGSQGGDMLHGTSYVSNQAIVDGGCGPNPCFLAPSNMSMNMHMLDLMYAPHRLANPDADAAVGRYEYGYGKASRT